MPLPSLRQIALFFSLALAPLHFLSAQDCPSLLVNGDFANQRGGYYSSYTENNNYLVEGNYSVTKNASALSAYMIPLVDHSPSGNTHYFAVSADVDMNKSAWKSTVAVKKGVTYEFSFWIANLPTEFQKINPDTLYSAQPAKVRFFIDNQPLLRVNTLPDNLWRKYVQVFTATRDAAVDIDLRNNANVFPVGGNDFALDDINFREICITTGDHITITTEDDYRVYPNPVRSETLFFGKKVSSFRLVSIANNELLQGTESESLSTEGLAKGLYFLHLDNKIFKVVIE